MLFVLPSFSLADSTYKVRKGDTILKIADKTIGITNDKKDPRRYKFAKEILAKNPALKEPYNLEPGQTIVLPDFKKAKTSAPRKAAPAIVNELPEESVQETGRAKKEDTVQSENMKLPVRVPKPQPLPEIPTPVYQEPEVIGETPSALVEAPKPHHNHNDFFFLQPRYQTDSYHLKNKTTDQKLELSSQSNLGMNLGYGKAWGESSAFVIEGGVSSVQMKNFAEEELTFDKRTILLKNLALGSETHLTPSVQVVTFLTYADYLVMVPDNLGTYFLKSVMMPGVEIALSWDAVHFGSSALGVNLTAGYIADGTLDGLKYTTGFEPAYALYWKSENGANQTNYRVDLRAGVSSQNSDLADQHADNKSLRFTAVFPL